ncbi:MAG TPA: ABC-F family ATP-binding cassette domain-containing protein [Elusimicrobiota bacterium]|nr:ABC-F family ATP-binding cassette domain-containing protein [Elusimicrobiota bacterium]
MITIRDVSKSFGYQTLFEHANLQINEGDRYALVGPNGSGKSTLFKMLLGEVEPDRGEMQMKRGVTAGYMPQETAPHTDQTVLEETLSTSMDADGRVEARAKEILAGLGFKNADFSKQVKTLSGGWAMRVVLARLLLEGPDMLMLDEPTNHLDMDALFWLQDYLAAYSGAIFLISHDRAFINKVCRSIVSLENQTLKIYHGDYEYFLAEKNAAKERLQAAYEQQRREIAEMEDFVARNRARFSSASRVQSTLKRLDKIERIELPPELKKVKIRFPQPARAGVRVLSLKNVSKAYGDVKVYEGLEFELERGWKMAFVGHNGAGKSTLLKMLAGVVPPDQGDRVVGLNVKVGYYSQYRTEMLDPNKTVLQEAMDNDRLHPDLYVRTVLGTFLFPGDTVFKKTVNLSGGEKSRLSLVKLLLDPPNVLLLDEPTIHLDISSVEALADALKEFEGTICCISHDIYFLNQLADHVVHVDQGRVTVYPGNYEYFERRQRQKEEEARVEEEAARPERTPDSPRIPARTMDPRKEERVRRAARREAEKKVTWISTEIEKARSRIALLAQQLESPEVSADYQKVLELGGQIESLNQDVAAKEQRLILARESLKEMV